MFLDDSPQNLKVVMSNDVRAQKGLILCDVDGVLNACPYMPGMVLYDWDFDIDVSVGAFQLHMSSEMAAVLASQPAQIEWLTTWCMYPSRDANADIGSLLGWPEKPQNRQLPGKIQDHHGWWKKDIFDAKRREDPARKIVWIDDDLTSVMLSMGAEPRTRFVGVQPPPTPSGSVTITDNGLTLLVCPEPDVGLTKAHMDIIRTFLES